ncbi:hypothetical protein C2G38_2029591 [Gigaspora rosea]|uniref:Uncharacterized protein n=1 Tax=Gigaspora rosea TaxID=44941 RepID=A0A397W0Q0_9GLOM|nr:hypothetical protein C2G38_2029591 [Gigaspora rosea]
MQTSITMFKRRRMNHNAKLKYNAYLSGHANTNQHVIIGRNAKKDGYVDTILCVKANGIAEKIGDAYRYIQYGAEIYGMKCQTKFECQKKPPHEKWKCPHSPECYNKWKCQNKWQCQHKEKCDMSNPLLKWKCQEKCQHRCQNKKNLKKNLKQCFNSLCTNILMNGNVDTNVKI